MYSQSDSDNLFTFSSSDGLSITTSVRLNPIHTAIVNLLNRSERPLLTTEIINRSEAPRSLRVVVAVQSYSFDDIQAIELPPDGLQRTNLLPIFVKERVAALKELTKASLYCRIDDLDTSRTVVEKTFPVHLLALDSAPIAALDPASGGFIDQTCYLGAFVTPNDPVIDVLLKEATNHLTQHRRLDGYQSHIMPQIRAIYYALAARGIEYIGSTVSFSPDINAQSIQRVRLPNQVINTGFASCIDSTLLFASLLERIGLEAAIVILPNHALVAWRSRPDGDWLYLETTLIAVNPFEKALEVGTKRAEDFEQDYTRTSDEGYFRCWPLNDLRAKGIVPISIIEGNELAGIAQRVEVGIGLVMKMLETLMQGVDRVGSISINKIEATNISFRDQSIDQSGAEMAVGDKTINAGGGAYVEGNVTVSGDIVRQDKIGIDSSNTRSDLSR